MLDAFDRQTETLLSHGYPQILGLDRDGFLARLAPLRARLQALPPPREARGNIPLCIAFAPGLVRPADAMAHVEARSATGIVDMFPLQPDDFHPVAGVDADVPSGEIYLLIDVDTGRDFLNISPEHALAAIRARGRTPLTLDEGVALTVQVPELLTDKARYNCIQMPGSRKPGDQRVPSIWFSKGAPRLGWCWDRNTHTWLGSASAACRVGAD